jgi:hypothetical protein
LDTGRSEARHAKTETPGNRDPGGIDFVGGFAPLRDNFFTLAEAQRSQSKNKQKTKGSDCFAAELSPPHRIPNKTQTAVFLSAISAPLRENFFG